MADGGGSSRLLKAPLASRTKRKPSTNLNKLKWLRKWQSWSYGVEY